MFVFDNSMVFYANTYHYKKPQHSIKYSLESRLIHYERGKSNCKH